MKTFKIQKNLTSDIKEEFKTLKLNILTHENDFLTKSIKKPKGSSKAA